MARARAAAADIIAGLRANDRLVVVAYAWDAAACSGLERDRTRLSAAVSAIDASDEPGNLPAALDFAAMVLRGHPHPTVIVVSDGGGGDVRDPAAVAAARALDLRYVPIGRPGRNVGLLAFSARRQPADPSSADLSLVVGSFQDTATDLDIVVTAGPNRIPIARQRLRIEPHARVARTLVGVPVPDPRLEARLDHPADDLPLDDRAYAVVPEPARLSVLAIGAPDLYLEGALLSLGAAVAVEHVPAQAMEASRARWPAADVVIFHGVVPPPEPATPGRFLYLDPRGPHSPWRGVGAADAGGDVRDPVVSRIVRDHPLVRGVSLVDLNVMTAHRLSPATGDTVVVAADRVPLLIARDRPGARAVALAFDPRRSDLPLRSAFPLWLANALTWLAERPEPEALSWPTGRTVRVGPAGTALTLDRVGFYTVGDGGGERHAPAVRVAANLASAEESDLAARPRLRVGDRVLAPPDSPPRHPRGPPRRAALALVFALALVTMEWLTFHRRLTV
jgi:Ca-activated chloride channel homolog